MRRIIREFLFPCSFLQKPTGLGRFYFEFECSICEGGKLDLHGHVASDVSGKFVELFAEFHHVDTQGTEGLTHFGIWFSDSREDTEVYCG